MAHGLDGKKIAILATDGFEEVELTKPRDALRAAGARIEIVSIEAGEIQGFKHFDKSLKVKVDRTLDQAKAEDYDALVIPGGVHNPDRMRIETAAQDFVHAFFETGKPVGAICHGPWVLIDAGVVEGRTMTSYKTIRQDLRNAGARVVDEEVVVDRGLVTSRCPDDLPAFCGKLIEEIAEGPHTGKARTAEETDAPRSSLH